VNAETGEPLWKTTVDTHAVSRIVGAPVLHEGRLYVPVSAAEEGAAREPKYQCCTFRGSVVAMNAADGAVIWKTYGIVDEPKPTKINSLGVQMFGPAGAAIWSAPTIDVKRGLIYVGTGNSYTDTQADGSNAIVAFDRQTGARRWATQATAKDNFVLGCGAKQSGQGNCPAKVGPDFDFGAAPILHTLPGGRQIILAGQKSGMVYGLDPDSAGKVLWKTSVGKGSALGGIEWGPAVDASTLYVAVADANVKRGGMPGLTALNAADGKRRWYVKTPNIKCSWGEDKCRRGQPGAVTARPGVVFSGALDGHIRAYDTRDGRIIWDADTSPAVATVNGPATEGGAIDAGGATLANGILYVNSGYGRWGKPGRLLIAYSVDGK
jgi:polyvinyl alcohol dehydrogenase (cytochrome)